MTVAEYMKQAPAHPVYLLTLGGLMLRVVGVVNDGRCFPFARCLTPGGNTVEHAVLYSTELKENESMQTTETVTYDHEGNVIERAVTQTPAPTSSVEIATDSKGNPKPTVKVYHSDPDEAAAEACRIYQEVLDVLQVSA